MKSYCSSPFPLPTKAMSVMCCLLLFVGLLACSPWINSPIVIGSSISFSLNPFANSQSTPQHLAVPPLSCPSAKANINCRPPQLPPTTSNKSSPTCPEYFRWIHEDLRWWKATGITKDMVEQASRKANFRLVVVDGRAYVEHYRKSFQTRDVFTLWGILQLLQRYHGRIPDLDLIFDCNDTPTIRIGGSGTPPPLFRYCGSNDTVQIVFPDWSFWGWVELNIKPWEPLLKELKKGNQRIKWEDRKPYAYWKGNPGVGKQRRDLFKCNLSNNQDWNTRLFAQDWIKEFREGYKQSNLADQCTYRYKIYIEGIAWSVSRKYIMACDSPSLVVTPRFYDFFTRGLMPIQHYWPLDRDDKCRSIKFAVDWGNDHNEKMQALGTRASTFIQQSLRMEIVYNYMFHALNEYAKLLKYKPMVPPKAKEICFESMACHAEGLEKAFMMQSMINASETSVSCALPPPFDPSEMKLLFDKMADSMKEVKRQELSRNLEIRNSTG